ncbi:hypothetical protein FNV43_RR01553 [Rhamnella rubrinervis]|uniref:Uncharacterized protein n=1 Tax=Rhamnella rubrinervis TaxID=2594499 RepID=A0A8K0HSP8_9ROSA|nr:hypothetical protein FNV43_RR01553 [Rhamnella rubrinervis]
MWVCCGEVGMQSSAVGSNSSTFEATCPGIGETRFGQAQPPIWKTWGFNGTVKMRFGGRGVAIRSVRFKAREKEEASPCETGPTWV